MSIRHEYAVRCVLDAYTVLSGSEDVSPHNPLVNHVLNRLVLALSEDYSLREQKLILDDPRVQAVRPELLQGLSRAESAMEAYWSDYFSARDSLSPDDLQEFWYWQNYKDLVKHEMDSVVGRLPDDGTARTAFIGAGPLPMTGLVMAMGYGVHVDCIDSDPAACIKAQALVDKLGLQDKVRVVLADGAGHDYGDYDYVLVASLVGDKASVIRAMHDTGHHGLMGVRSAEKLHTLLYEPFDDQDVAGTEYGYAGATPYIGDVINTTLFYQNDVSTAHIAGQANEERGRQAALGIAIA